MGLAKAIQDLHDRCAIYTSAPTASRLLDLIGWTEGFDLSKSVLLEPCLGEGAIMLEAARRLIGSMRAFGRSLTKTALRPRIMGFELHPGAARSARIELRLTLIKAGIRWGTANDLADAWVSERDFLLERPLQATHVAANPPYVRWRKLPSILASAYRNVLPANATRGDVSVAFLHRMQEWAHEHGAIAALVSDRWMYAQYGEEFLRETRVRGWFIKVADERPLDPFVRDVGAYSAIVLLTKERNVEEASGPASRAAARSIHGALVARHGTLGSAGCQVRVGPALGAGKTFILGPGEPIGVEAELIRPFVCKQELTGGEVMEPLLQVIVPYDRAGKLIDPAQWPGFARWAEVRRDVLATRSHFIKSGQYWRTIDAVTAHWSTKPKLLLPELCSKLMTTIDRTGSIPAHSIYAIWSDEWPIDILQRVLNSGLLELTARAEAPKLKLGWIRFYKRFIVRTPLPKWSTLTFRDQAGLAATGQDFDDTFFRLFEFQPGAWASS